MIRRIAVCSIFAILCAGFSLLWVHSLPPNEPITSILPTPGMDCVVCVVWRTTVAVSYRDVDEAATAVHENNTRHILEMQAQHRTTTLKRGVKVGVLSEWRTASGDTWVSVIVNYDRELSDPSRYTVWIPRIALQGQTR